jgi:hypothetical protein
MSRPCKVPKSKKDDLFGDRDDYVGKEGSNPNADIRQRSEFGDNALTFNHSDFSIPPKNSSI